MANPVMNQMAASSKSPALASMISNSMFGKKKKKTAMPAKNKAVSAAKNSMAMQTQTPPKGIAVGNPNALKT